MTTPIAIYCPGQYVGSRPEDLEYEDRFGLLLHPVAWVDDSPVVTYEAFKNWIATWAANDRNGNWGAVFEYELVEGLHMVQVSGDGYHRIKMDHPAGWPIKAGMTRTEVLDFDSEVSIWPVGDGGVYRLADCPDWADEWVPLTSLDQFVTH